MNLSENTVIVLWSDHGLFLGEHGRWNKHSNLEVPSTSPVIIYAPYLGVKGKAYAPVSTVDIFPTLCELAGLVIPEQPKNNNISNGRPIKGRSLVPILKDTEAHVKMGAITVYRGKLGLGYSYRVKEGYRYIEWVKQGKVQKYELYNYNTDPYETGNLAVLEKDKYEPLMHKLSNNMRNMGEAAGCLALLKTKALELSNMNKAMVRDFDKDGISDETEGAIDTDGDGIMNYLDSDSDNDGISDKEEGTGDKDNDGIEDYLDRDDL